MNLHTGEIRALRPDQASQTPLRLAVIGNYPPRRCGIASFTADMVDSLREAAPQAQIDVYAMTRDADACRPEGVTRMVIEGDRDSCRAAGHAIEESCVDAVWVQHEFGIFGGEAGELVIDLLASVAAPLIVTLHTVLAAPDPAQARVIDWFVAHASRLVVMSHGAAEILRRREDVLPDQVVVIEHGAPDRPFGRSGEMKRMLGLPDAPMLLTFGLLSPGKGIEMAIGALARLVDDHPETRYVVAGVTHPNLAAREGEAYRQRLMDMARRLEVDGNIVWLDEYLDTPGLLDLIEAADIYLTPYTGASQSTSGTLSYAVALGKAVVSTPYAHAVQLLADGHGILTGFHDAEAMAAAIGDLLALPDELERLQRRAWQRGRTMIWPHFARRSLQVIDAVRTRAMVQLPRTLPGEDDLERLCDDNGMIQHSVLGVCDRSHGYCVDDNARALILATLAGGRFADRAGTFAAFVQDSWNPDLGRFRNFMGYDRVWREQEGSEDSCGRTLWALGVTAAQGLSADLREWAVRLWREAAAMAGGFGSPRALAFAMLGADRMLDADPDDHVARGLLEHGAQRLDRGLASFSRPGWRWFEPVLAYDNCRLPEALLTAARRLGSERLADDALDALRWIMDCQTAPAGHFRPIGSEAFGSIERPWQPFDQQPVDTWATVDAAVLAFRHTGDPAWRRQAERAFAWFFGTNDRGLALADGETGSCMDGLTPHGVNRNRGAESVLALHLAAHSLATLQCDWRRWMVRDGTAGVAKDAALLPG